MLVSFAWLKYYVDLPETLTPAELALQLTMSTVEVESVKDQAEFLDGVVVGEILEITKHSDANKLQVCTVSDGSENYQVVCGGINLKTGMKVALAKIGAKVQWHGEGELVELAKAKIRGVESNGMICASTEIGLGELFPLKDNKEILDLSGLDFKVGQPLFKALGLNDAVFDIDNKSMTHRPDLWGHYGLAREVAALNKQKLKNYQAATIKAGKEVKLKVEVKDKELCPRYLAVAIAGIKIAPSPQWLQKLLLAVGLRPINNIVDITNFLLLDLGQPMHAFDKRQLVGDKIIVRRAKVNEKFTTLDEQEHKLDETMLLIADEKKAVALAGIMGGLNSEIKEDTTTIVYESANFDATNIRRTAVKLGLRTESSARFEKSLDPKHAELALKRAVELTLQICPDAKVISPVVDEAYFKLNQGPIKLDLEFLKMKMGVEVEKKQVINILESLGFGVKEKKENLLVTVPTWRATKDISIPEDLVEEVARVYGYDNITTCLPEFPIIPPERNELRLLERKCKDILSKEYSFSESYNYSFVSPLILEKLGMDIKAHIELANPIAKDRSYLRRSLLPNLLENVEKNLHSVENLKLFEIGKIFDKNNNGEHIKEDSDEFLPRQDIILELVYSAKGDEEPFYEASSALAGLLNKLGVAYELKVLAEGPIYLHPGRQAEVLVIGESLGLVAELHPHVQLSLGINSRVSFVELNLNKLLAYVTDKSKYIKMFLYPAIQRDIAFVVDKKVEHRAITKVLEKVDKLIHSVELFDVFVGGKVGENKKSLAYHLLYQSAERTLTSEEVDEIQKKVAEVLEKKFKVEVRK